MITGKPDVNKFRMDVAWTLPGRRCDRRDLPRPLGIRCERDAGEACGRRGEHRGRLQIVLLDELGDG